MRISGNNENLEQLLMLFSSENSARIRDMNARIRGEEAVTARGRGPLTGRGYDLTASFDDIMSARNPNHIRGLDVTNGMDRRIIDLPDYVHDAIIAFSREQFTRGLGMADWRDGERFTMLRHSFLRDIPEQDRQAALYTMDNIFRTENRRQEAAIREAMPNWMPGQRVPDEILRPILNGHGSFSVTA